MLLLSRCCAVAVVALVIAGSPQAAPQETKKTPTIAEDKQALLGDWQLLTGKEGDSTLTKLRFTDRYARMLIFWQTATNFEAGGSQFEYQFVEKNGKRSLVLFGADRDRPSGSVTYHFDGDKLRLSGAGVALNNRKYDLTGEWTRPKKKK